MGRRRCLWRRDLLPIKDNKYPGPPTQDKDRNQFKKKWSTMWEKTAGFSLKALSKIMKGQKPIRHIRIKNPYSIEQLTELKTKNISPMKASVTKALSGLGTTAHSKELLKANAPRMGPEMKNLLRTKGLPSFKKIDTATKQLSDKPTIMSPKGGVAKLMTRVTGTKFTPKQSKHLGTFVIAHERMEMQAAKRLGKRAKPLQTGHIDPDVLLREHNLRVKLPPSQNKTIEKFIPTSLRQQEIIPRESFTFGKSPRLSRHARRRVRDLILKNN